MVPRGTNNTPHLQPAATNTSIFMSESSFFVQNDGSMKSAIVEITQLRFQSRGRTSLHKLLQRYRQSHSRSTLDHGQPFSWLSCLISMVSYTLLLSDVLRTGLGVRRLPRGTWKLEPDAAIFIGPSSYTTIHLTLKNASGASGIRYWPYKYDTTSIAMRSLAQLFNLPTWKPCLLYHATCDETHGLPFRAVFSMIDSLVHAVSTHSTEVKFRTSRRQMARGHITIRTENVFKDRLHHYALPWFFGCTIKRTNQAIYYQFESHQPISVALCESIQSPRPLSCQENWTRKTPDSCSGLRNVCTGSDDAWTALKNRLYFLASVYRNSSIDFVIIDGTEDFTRGGLTFQGQSFDEVVLLSRIRQCSDKQCATIAIDDSRYESAQFVMNASGWLNVVGSLRVVGQVYTWLRVVLLIRVHHLARQGTSEKYRKASLLHKAFVNIRTLFLIPSQIVIYGSLLPISLYLLAHLIDSPATYELVAIRFNSLFGQVTWTFADFLNHCAVSMRSVWLLSFLCHGVLAATTKRLWSLSNGIPGVPELFISFLASLTIWAQFRVIAWRDTRVLQVHEVVPSARMYRVRDYRQYAARAPLSALLFGSTIDMQCVESAVLGALIVRLLLSILRRLIPKRFPFEVTLVSRTLVPYSAGSLWPRNRLVVNWFGSLITRTPAVSPTKTSFRRRSVLPAGSSAVAEYDSSRRLPSFIRAMPDRGLVVRDTEATRVVWQEMQSIDQRSVEVESTIYLMNLAVMTDPISVLRLRFFSGCSVGLYVSKYSRRWHLLPYGLKSSTGDIAIDWNQLELLAVINTKHLEWDDLLRCG